MSLKNGPALEPLHMTRMDAGGGAATLVAEMEDSLKMLQSELFTPTTFS